jgi:undecaprenyl pyrophosphate phosphatase UppP
MVMGARLVALYVGPDQMMPVMSVLASIVAVLMIFWNKVLGLIRRILGLARRSESPAPPAGPEPPKQA